MSFFIPAHDLVLHIFAIRIMMASKWDRSPTSLKMFMAAPVLGLDLQQ